MNRRKEDYRDWKALMPRIKSLQARGYSLSKIGVVFNVSKVRIFQVLKEHDNEATK